MVYISNFVITYNHQTKKFALDQDICDAHFNDGCIYSEDHKEYLEANIPHEILDGDFDANEALLTAINELNAKSNKENNEN